MFFGRKNKKKKKEQKNESKTDDQEQNVQSRSSLLGKVDKEDEKESKQKEKNYIRNIQRLEETYANLIDVNTYKDILFEDEDTSIKRAMQATPEDIEREISLLIGSPKQWSSESDEVKLFRENIKKAKTTTACPGGQKLLPPRYITTDTLPENLNKPFICTVHFPEFHITKTLKCNPDYTANTFAINAIEKITVSHDMIDKCPDSWIFKATGTAEYLYGDVRMIDFEHIRKCLKNRTRVELSMISKEDALKESDQKLSELRNISFDFSFSKSTTGWDHDEINFESNSWDTMTVISLWDFNRPLRVRIKGVDNIKPTEEFLESKKNPENCLLYVEAVCYHSGNEISSRFYTNPVPFSASPRYNNLIEFDLNMANIPRETRIGFTVFAQKDKGADLTKPAIPKKKDYPIGWVNFQLIDHKGILKTGGFTLGLWPDDRAKPSGSCIQNLGLDGIPASIQIELDTYSLPVVIPSKGTPTERMEREFENYERTMRQKFPPIRNQEELKKELERIIRADPLYQLNDEEKWRIWDNKEKLKHNPKALPKFLLSVNWKNPVAVKIAHRMLYEWEPPSKIDALELLDYNYADAKVRQYALQQIDKFEDGKLADFILQLVQTLKFESYHDSSVGRFLLQRGIQCPHLIGHILFWHLKSEMHRPEIRERFGLILEEYLRTCCSHRRDLLKQNAVLDQLLAIAMKIKKTKKSEHKKVLHAELRKLILPPKFKLPLNPRMEVIGIEIEKSKVMDSKKLPLWLEFINADRKGKNIKIIFKAGDDLRQDLLTLQMLRIMDKLWKEQGLDLHMQPYGCVSTGDGVGMIEVVVNSATIANITASRGGALTAFKETPLYEWLKEKNPKEADWPKIVDNFVYSCAGYCNATYILGIGDRHNDNIMLTQQGDLFHIDFGHFLGHFKTFAGIQRETTPFVFTPMYAYVMGGVESEAFRKFEELGGRAFNIIRAHGHLIMTLFSLMLACGIPELKSVDDVLWLRKCLVLDKTDEEAAKYFKELIQQSLKNFRAMFNDYIHIFAHSHLK